MSFRTERSAVRNLTSDCPTKRVEVRTEARFFGRIFSSQKWLPQNDMGRKREWLRFSISRRQDANATGLLRVQWVDFFGIDTQFFDGRLDEGGIEMSVLVQFI
jgi:hypothetical protein